ncbi:beta-hydroxyacyl-ACP dehydratase [Bermanella marisrubri]|uniref:Putative (3R)-hydroxymyristol-(Acyl carrier protein) dehydratase n=1 Tax=Bermanella marisrubri TaxID=207949 RepID=Q1N372_9GAMM|nr:3-hydroxyacyl-ACP dehydratase FabZ family protein [Bermanella marisrubri]EAT12719.1 putative (3R)-hydroxymyristol-(acyl carrier protein) dehydratase [Oceanobacter sp. RED65] [Bermanella marisrubri]QIZ85162.1 beta-hydroxyacyl-ACP dehydratase [Bermanella marisrubri]
MTTVTRRKRVGKDFILVEPFMLQKLSVFRQPFMMVDRIVNFQDGEKPKIQSIKTVASNEPHFVGHFPGYPVMPGVLIAETFGQTSEYMNLILQFIDSYEQDTGIRLEDPHELKAALHCPQGIERAQKLQQKTMGFLASQDLKFKGVVYPGDVLEISSEMFLVDSAGFNHFNVEARVGKKIVCSGRMSNWRQTDIGFGFQEPQETEEEIAAL